MDDYEECFDCYDMICDCCGTTQREREVHTLDMGCSITLCRECVLRFYALLDKGRTRRILRLLDNKGINMSDEE